jgi:hypothetical protein
MEWALNNNPFAEKWREETFERESLVTYKKNQDFAKKDLQEDPTIVTYEKKKPYKIISLGFMNSWKIKCQQLTLLRVILKGWILSSIVVTKLASVEQFLPICFDFFLI